MSTRTLNSKRNIITGVLSNCLIPVFSFIVKTAIVRCFSIEYIGLTSVFSSIFQVLNLAELGFSTAIIVNLYKPLKENDIDAVRGILAYFKRIYIIIGLIVMIAGIVVSPMLKTMVGDTRQISENIYILYFLYLADTTIRFLLFAYKEALFNAIQRFDITKIVYIIIYIVRTCLQLLAIIVFKSFYLYAVVLVICTAVYYIVLQLISKNEYGQYYPDGKIDENTRNNIKEQVAGLSVSKALGASRDSVKSIIITSFLGLYVSGQYSNYYTVFNAVLGFFLVITKAIQASIGNSIVSETVEKNYRDLTKMEFLHNMFITACTAYLVSLYQPFMKLWMGKKFMFPDSIMFLFVIYFYILAMSEVRNAFFSALGYWWKAKGYFVTEALVNVVLIVCLGKFFGLSGIVIATSLTLLIVNYIGITNLLFKEYFVSGRKGYYTNRIIYTLITLIISGVSYYFCVLIPYGGWPGLIIKLVVCSVIVVVLIPSMMFIFKRKYLKESIAFIRQIIKA